ncbi:FAD-dependent oxidoreductase [Candidatus Woesearchaeota archaeon]|nr:FAD-dependent oxidoreductase [Candidatus Woesearchaeota archaeon]
MEYDFIVIGGGVTGYAAAMYAGRMNLKALVIAESPGGTIILTDVVENYPGFKKIAGIELADRIKEHALDYSVEMKNERVVEVSRSGKGFNVKTASGEYLGKSLCFATGARWRELKVPGHDEFRNKGVHYCALCDGFFYKGKRVIIVGGSDSAVKEALHLSEVADEVFIVYRKPELTRPEPINMARLKKAQNIRYIFSTNITEFKGDKSGLTSVVFDNAFNGSKEFQVDGVFVAIGAVPNSDIAKPLGVETNKKGEILINRKSETNVPGVFAAGDVTDSGFKQAITGVSEGVTAAFYAFEYVGELDL